MFIINVIKVFWYLIAVVQKLLISFKHIFNNFFYQVKHVSVGVTRNCLVVSASLCNLRTGEVSRWTWVSNWTCCEQQKQRGTCWCTLTSSFFSSSFFNVLHFLYLLKLLLQSLLLLSVQLQRVRFWTMRAVRCIHLPPLPDQSQLLPHRTQFCQWFIFCLIISWSEA